MASTNNELVWELSRKPASAARDALIKSCLANDFHDFKSDRHDTPKMALVTALRAAGYQDLAKRAMDGEWDETPDAEDKAAMEREVGPELIRALGLKR